MLGWQGNNWSPYYPFGTQTAQILSSQSPSSTKTNSIVNATIQALPGDCLGAPGCTSNAQVTGYFPRLTAFFASTTMQFDWIVLLGGGNDVLKACYSGNTAYLDAVQDQTR